MQLFLGDLGSCLHLVTHCCLTLTAIFTEMPGVACASNHLASGYPRSI